LEEKFTTTVSWLKSKFGSRRIIASLGRVIRGQLEKFSQKSQRSMCYFVAPSIFIDSKRQIDYIKEKEKLTIYPKTIEEFLEHLEKEENLYCNI
jgi:hypothetical protein